MAQMALYQYLRPTTTPAVEVTGTSTKTPAPDTSENLYPRKFRIKEDSSNPQNIEPSKSCTHTVYTVDREIFVVTIFS